MTEGSAFLPHHAETIGRTSEHFAADPSIVGLLLAGSIAHGFATTSSDVDVMIVVSDSDYRERLDSGRTCFFSRELSVYADGYVDGKYVSEALLREVATRGSEPARFAFQDARVLFSRSETLTGLVASIARYPVAQKAERIERFRAQFEAWHWYAGEARKRGNLPLLRMAVAKLTLFAGRAVLAHNELLYPYHKWFLRVLAAASSKPDALLERIEEIARDPTPSSVDRFADEVRTFMGWQREHTVWPVQFMIDSELNWLHHAPPIDDI